ncbi:MAG: Wzz/FepE/Etk N-terminal domain-containing protein [Cyanobium sp. LacPavin_0920_WC12_MAG_62_9]|nr:Wzz/FepE/Etk N-terminal domain-containing protein [Cyanobium sp. LacPavin_0920_WC12_MAG_62_9]
MTTPPITAARPNSLENSDEINLAQLGAALKRHSRLIAKVTGGTLLLTLVATLLQKPVWEGEFQIVLASNGGGGGRLAQLTAANPGLAGVGGGGGKGSLETEVQILQSPSVLKPVFDFVRNSKRQAGENIDKIRYEDWLKSNLEIQLEKGTSVLNISYRDSDKPLILPVIDRISKTYQAYSGRDRRRDIANAVAYLKGRINDLEPKADASMRRAQGFALTNGLGIQDGIPMAAGDAGSGGGSGGSVEGARQAAQREVINLRQQLANARGASSNVLYQAPQLTANEDLFKSYQTLEAEIAEKRSRLRDNDEIIRALKRQRTSLILTLNRQTIGLLEGQLATAQASLQATTRPKDVVLAHRQLVRQALRDEKTLTDLENQLQLASLEQAKQTDPWELISTPTMLDRPVSPRKGRNLALGLLAGLVLGSGAALVVDRKSGQVFAIDELKASLPYPLLAQLQEGVSQRNHQTLQLLAQGALEAPHSVALIPIGMGTAAARSIATSLQSALQEDNHNAEVLCSSDLLATRHCSIQILLTAPGAATRAELAALVQQLQLQGTPVAGWLLLQPTTKPASDA